ncbi:hypothetical protein ACQEPB_03440 [Novosphingobium fluoreni]|uniref:hypothetical protein n=1 Tax=Novosphingobium fluoreni TaxID=1391222 RepID=UPI003DA10C7D
MALFKTTSGDLVRIPDNRVFGPSGGIWLIYQARDLSANRPRFIEGHFTLDYTVGIAMHQIIDRLAIDD